MSDAGRMFSVPDWDAFVEGVVRLEMERRAWEEVIEEAGLTDILDPPHYAE